MSRGPRLTKEQDEMIAKLYAEGASINTICEKVGKKYVTVYQALRRLGVWKMTMPKESTAPGFITPAEPAPSVVTESPPGDTPPPA